MINYPIDIEILFKTTIRASFTFQSFNFKDATCTGTQVFFNQQRLGPPGGDGIQNDINTKEKLWRPRHVQARAGNMRLDRLHTQVVMIMRF